MMIPQRGGLPHSDTPGSKPARSSPRIFAACHVLHRLLAPRHPPDALLILTYSPVIPANQDDSTRHAQEPSTPTTHLNGTKRTTEPKPRQAQTTLLNSAHINAPDRCTRTNTRSHHPSPHREKQRSPGQTPVPAQARTPHDSPQREPPEMPCAPRDAPEPDSQSPKNIHTQARHQPPRFAEATGSTPDPNSRSTYPCQNTRGNSQTLLHDDACPEYIPRHTWWRRTGSNRRPPACKAGALPAELRPQGQHNTPDQVVGQGGLEPPTPRLSSVCSNQLSY